MALQFTWTTESRFGRSGKLEWMCSELCSSELPTCTIRCWTGNQCSWCSIGLKWDRFDACSTIRATLFWTRCSFWMVPDGTSWCTALQ